MMKISAQKRSHVRFTEEEYEIIVKDANNYKHSIPEQLKSVFFCRKIATPVMYPDDARRAIVELNRIGNNVNQIARKLNSGSRYGFTPVLEEMARDIRSMTYFLEGHDGNRKN
jgi:hypothetical protein